MTDIQLVMIVAGLLLIFLIGLFAWMYYIQSKFDKDVYEILGIKKRGKKDDLPPS